MSWSSRCRHLLAVIAGAAALGIPVAAAGAHASAAPAAAAATATSPGSPVNLAASVNFADGVASKGAVVSAGDARFEVLGNGLIRMEYSPAKTFEDLPTVNVVDRRFPVPAYKASVSGGWLTIATAAGSVRYKVGSGPFGPSNVAVSVAGAGGQQAARLGWQDECPFGQACDAGAATLAGPAAIQTDHAGYQSVAGFVANLAAGNNAGATWSVLGAPAGPAQVSLRYANYVGALGGPAPRTIDLVVNGSDTGPVTLPATASWDAWSTVTANVTLNAGTNTVGLLCAAGDSCNVNVDTLAASAPGSAPPAIADPGYLGGYTRGFDTATYGSPGYSCPAGTPAAAQCTAALPEMHPGILDKAGYRLLDDTDSATWTKSGWVAPRAAGGDAEDGYLFVYGDDYKQALTGLDKLTGPSPLLDESNFGVWYSDYYPYSSSDYEDTLIPQFRSNGVPLDDLSVDTDWKSPNNWDGWEWNDTLFPDPEAFLSWAHGQGIDVTLNVHASIASDDPQLAATQSLAGGALSPSSCFNGSCDVWDWSDVAQAESYFELQQPYQASGVDFWWLDWCCDSSTASMPGLTPDDWINHLYAADLANQGQRGFVLSRTGSSYQDPDEVYPAGPWSGHTSTLAFTGDSWGTWNTLALQAQLAPDEASIDEPYVSNDIGSFLGPVPGSAQDDADLYARWVQLGTFQPVDRLHSSAGNRLPWQYPAPADAAATAALQLREALVPYTYTLAAQSVATGLPITQPLYLDYPSAADAYSHPGEYLYGPSVLVAPVTSPGNVAKQTVWFPPGTWTDWFTGATFHGPSTQTLTVPLNQMPVFVKAGGIVPLQAPASHAGADPTAPTTLRVYPGAPGSFSLYSDAGSGTGYEKGQSSLTTVTSSAQGAVDTVAIGPARGSFPGEQATRSFTVDVESVSRPTAVLVDGRPAAGWSYDAAAHTVSVPVTGLPRSASATVKVAGASAVQQAEPAAIDLGITPAAPLSLSPGQSATVTTTESNDGPGAATGAKVTLSTPTGWTITPAGPVPAGTIANGAKASQTWTVTAPATATGPASAALTASLRYASAGLTQQVTAAEQAADAAAPPPAPVITSVSPSSADPGGAVTITGSNFGDTQGSSYLTLSQGGTSWGAPYDGAQLAITSWSDSSITFDLPPGEGSDYPWPIDPGQSTVTVTVSGQTTAAATITVNGTAASAPTLSGATPATTTAGSSVTLAGSDFGSSQGDSYLTLSQGGTSWGAPYDGAQLTITSWSDSSITFELPPNTGSFPLEPGTATITVTVGGQASAPQALTITGLRGSAGRSGAKRVNK